MKFLSVNDIEGRHHLVNPAHIAVIQEADAGSVIHLRGRWINPIVLSETVEVMRDALMALEESEARATRPRRFRFGHGPGHNHEHARF
jgi:hypothetical protein